MDLRYCFGVLKNKKLIDFVSVGCGNIIIVFFSDVYMFFEVI